MTTYYFDSVLGNDANAGTSIVLAKQNFNPFNGFTPIAGDTVLFKRGTTQTITGALKSIRGGSSDTARICYGAYGVASVQYSIWKYGTGAGNIILNASAQSFLTFEDMYFDMRSSDCRYPMNFASSGATACSGHRVARCFFQGANSPTLHIGNGLTLAPATGATGLMENYVIEDSEFFDNDGHGLIVINSRFVAVRRCKFYRNGANDPNGGHGFSSRYNRTDAPSGWTLTATTVWQRAMAAVEPDVYYVLSTVTGYTRLRRTAGTQSTPAVGEFGVLAAVLYINVGSASNPSGQSIRYAWGRCYGLTVEENESYSNYYNVAAPFHEGHGFAFDDFADDSIFRRNKSYNNQGAGFSNNRGDRNTINSNVAYGNWQSAVVMNPNDSLNIIHNTFYSNNAGTGAYAGEIQSFGYNKDAVISNNIIIALSAYCISRETTDTGFSGVTNALSGAATAAEKNASVTGTVTTAPALDVNYRPTVAALQRTGTGLGYKDYNNKQFYNPPNIGAVDGLPTTATYLVRNT